MTQVGTSGPNATALRERRLYLWIGAGDSERSGPPPTSMLNPAGSTSRLVSTILELRFSQEIDTLVGTLRLTMPRQLVMADGGGRCS